MKERERIATRILLRNSIASRAIKLDLSLSISVRKTTEIMYLSLLLDSFPVGHFKSFTMVVKSVIKS